MLQLSEARKNLSELVNQAYYQGKLFGISKGKKSMGIFIGTREWTEIVKTIEMYDLGLADTLALTVDPELQAVIQAGEQDIKDGKLVPLDQV